MKNKPLVLFLSLLAILLTSNIAFACGCGCKGDHCGTNNQPLNQQQIKNPLLPSQELDKKVDYKSKTSNVCCEGCKEPSLKDPKEYGG